MTIEQRDDSQHIFIILIITYSLGISIEEWYILMLRELLAKLVDVYSLVVRVNIIIVEGIFRDEVYDVIIVIQTYHRTIHPRLVLCYKCEIRISILYYHRDNIIAEDEIALDEQCIILLQLILDDS